MKPFTVEYDGKLIEFLPLDKDGYMFNCPLADHGAYNWIDTESGTRHKLQFDEQGRATIVGSVVCLSPDATGQRCGWHVIVTDGVAHDA